MLIVRCGECGAFVLRQSELPEGRRVLYFPCPVCQKRTLAVEILDHPLRKPEKEETT
jgi:endogenous inhibitor of DNA gyrase (YacG/DUF329 family)